MDHLVKMVRKVKKDLLESRGKREIVVFQAIQENRARKEKREMQVQKLFFFKSMNQ